MYGSLASYQLHQFYRLIKYKCLSIKIIRYKYDKLYVYIWTVNKLGNKKSTFTTL